MKRFATNRKGIALVLALFVIVISAGILAAIMYYSTSGTETAGIQRNYESAKEASLGGLAIFTKEMIPRALKGETLPAIVSSFSASTIFGATQFPTGSCVTSKLNEFKAAWTCSDPNPMDPTSNPDFTLTLNKKDGGGQFLVSMKIADTAVGSTELTNSGRSIGKGLFTKGVVARDNPGGDEQSSTTKHIPFLYTIVVEGESVNTARQEKAIFEVLYAY